MSSRLVEVEPERLPGWVARFSAAHGGAAVEVVDGGAHMLVAATDGSRAELEVPWPPLVACDDLVAALAAHAAEPRTALLLLVRRGGWAVGLAREAVVLDGTCGTRYVQSRTAAGGWSQQRYARRRANQADGLVSAAATGLNAVLARGSAPEVLVPGGDRQLVADVLAAVALPPLPRGPLLDVPDPRRRVLDEVARRARCLRVRVDQSYALPPMTGVPQPE